MKHFNKLLVAGMMAVGLNSHAQDSNNPWAITLGVNAVDTKTNAGGGHNWLDENVSHQFDVKNNWNILPSISYLNVSRYLGSNISFGISGSINKITKAVYYRPAQPASNNYGYQVENPGDLMYYGIDGMFKYSFKQLIRSKIFDPFVDLGAGYTFLGKHSYANGNIGAGITFWFNQNIGLSLAATGKRSFDQEESKWTEQGEIRHPSVMQYTAGVVFQFGEKDTDKDGVQDKDDACPTIAGLKQFQGCPDTDGDGIPDKDDACPEVAGSKDFNGCPDTDGDGVTDKEDKCPNASGPKENFGCPWPDTDSDGVLDKDDKCPSVAGPRENRGCPWPDADGDGIPDREDKCPTLSGPVSNQGCPEVTDEVLKELKTSARSIYFNTGKATFKAGDTAEQLNAIREILKNYPNAKFSIEGHTDNVGKPAANLKLSEERANAVRNALIDRGVNPDNLTAKGFGDTKPIMSNKTPKGKAENRRTEIVHVGSAYEGKL